MFQSSRGQRDFRVDVRLCRDVCHTCTRTPAIDSLELRFEHIDRCRELTSERSLRSKEDIVRE